MTLTQLITLFCKNFNKLHFNNKYNFVKNISTGFIMNADCSSKDRSIVSLEECRRFIIDCMKAVGAPEDNATILADNLVEADYRGHFSHGMNRLEFYIKDVESGICDVKAKPEIIKETIATAWVNGNNGLGAVVGKYCINWAIEKAKQCGVGWVVAKGSNHYGMAGIYSLEAIKNGYIGMSFTNTSPLMAPTRAKTSALGTNPLSLGAPGNKHNFLLDMATTSVALGKIEMKIRNKHPLPEGWALDKNGQITKDAEAAYEAARLMPLGGAEEFSGYKGYGLGVLVEILSGISAGSCYGPYIRKWGDKLKEANLGQCFIAIDPKNFAPDFDNRLDDLIEYLRNMDAVDPQKPVLVAGDPEIIHMRATDEAGGVHYVQNQLDACQKLAERLNVNPLQLI